MGQGGKSKGGKGYGGGGGGRRRGEAPCVRVGKCIAAYSLECPISRSNQVARHASQALVRRPNCREPCERLVDDVRDMAQVALRVPVLEEESEALRRQLWALEERIAASEETIDSLRSDVARKARLLAVQMSHSSAEPSREEEGEVADRAAWAGVAHYVALLESKLTATLDECAEAHKMLEDQTSRAEAAEDALLALSGSPCKGGEGRMSRESVHSECHALSAAEAAADELMAADLCLPVKGDGGSRDEGEGAAPDKSGEMLARLSLQVECCVKGSDASGFDVIWIECVRYVSDAIRVGLIILHE